MCTLELIKTILEISVPTLNIFHILCFDCNRPALIFGELNWNDSVKTQLFTGKAYTKTPDLYDRRS